jgi:hypothetical protein
MPTKTHRVQNYYHMHTSRGGKEIKANIYCLCTPVTALEHWYLCEYVVIVTVTCRLLSVAFDLLWTCMWTLPFRRDKLPSSSVRSIRYKPTLRRSHYLPPKRIQLQCHRMFQARISNYEISLRSTLEYFHSYIIKSWGTHKSSSLNRPRRPRGGVEA